MKVKGSTAAPGRIHEPAALAIFSPSAGAKVRGTTPLNQRETFGPVFMKTSTQFLPVKRVKKGRTVKLGVSTYSEMVAVDAIVVCIQSTPNFPSWQVGLSGRETR